MTLGGSSAPARVELCGRLHVELDGRRVDDVARGRQGRLLLAYLVLNRHAAVSRDQLIGAVWGDEAAREPAAVLSTLLSHLRRALGEGRLEGRRELRLDLGPDAYVDVEEAAALRDRAFDALARSSFAEAAAAAATAAEIVAAEVLPGHDADWLEAVRADVRDVRADALEALARAGLALGRDELAGATAAAATLVKTAPFRESGYALLMEAHAQRGNVAEALRVFETLRTLLRDELGIAPAPFLIELHERLLMQAPAGGAGGAGAPADGLDADVEAARLPLPAPLERDTGFVGRGPLLTHLGELLGEVAAGARRFAFVAGEPGIGKTTLAARFAREAHAGGALVLYGRADEDGVLTYQPFVEALVHYVAAGPPERLEPAANPQLAELARLLPDAGLAPRELQEPSRMDPETQRFRMFEAMAAVLDLLAAGAPLVLVVDDLHWADRSTLLMLRHLARAARPARMLVVATYRDVEVDRDHPLAVLTGDLRRAGVLAPLRVDGFDEQETRALIEARGGPAALAGRLCELTAGNPFFIEEVLATLPADGVDAPALAGIAAKSEGVKEMIARRLARLDPRAPELLTIAAVLGEEFRLPVLEELAGSVHDEHVLPVLEEAVAARLIVEAGGRAETFRFTHALVREALYGMPTRARRARLHRRAGEVLERRRRELAVHPAELAHHFLEAGATAAAEAVAYAREAAAHALESLAYEQAAALLERAATAAEELPGADDVRCETLLALGEARTRAGSPAARQAFADAAALARDRWPERLARAAVGFGGRYFEAGVVDAEFIALLEEALRALPDERGHLRTRVVGRLAEALHFAGDAGRALALSDGAVADARTLGDEQALVGALDARHTALLHVAHVEQRLALAGELYAVGRARGQAEVLVQALQHRMFDLLEAGDSRAARRTHDELKRLAAELRQPLFRAHALGWTGLWLLFEGRFEEAERLSGELFELHRTLGARDAETALAARMFAIRREQGRLAELAPVVEGLIADFPALAPWRAVLPLVHAEAGDHARAEAALAEFVAGVDALPHDFFWLTALAGASEAAAVLADRAAAARLLPLLEPHAGRMVQVGYLANLGPVDRLLGLLARTAGDATLAVRHLERALEIARRFGARTVTVRAECELGELLAGRPAADDRDRGRELLQRSLTGARELAMAGVAARAERQLAAVAA